MSENSIAGLIDVEDIVVKSLNERLRYRLVANEDDDMLSWKQPVQVQQIPGTAFQRVGTVGDGNCMLHAIMFAISPTYRFVKGDERSAVADRFREALVANQDLLSSYADEIYAPKGGAVIVEEALDSLSRKREELSVEFGPVIGKLYGFNFLAVQFRDGEGLVPVGISRWGFDPANPTVLVNYLGGAVNVENAAGFMGGGHYETMIAGELEGAGSATQISADAIYSFPPGNELIETLLGMFPDINSEAPAEDLEVLATEGLSPAAAVAAVEEKAAGSKAAAAEAQAAAVVSKVAEAEAQAAEAEAQAAEAEAHAAEEEIADENTTGYYGGARRTRRMRLKKRGRRSLKKKHAQRK